MKHTKKIVVSVSKQKVKLTIYTSPDISAKSTPVKATPVKAIPVNTPPVNVPPVNVPPQKSQENSVKTKSSWIFGLLEFNVSLSQ